MWRRAAAIVVHAGVLAPKYAADWRDIVRSLGLGK
jgi:hypothetical protein